MSQRSSTERELLPVLSVGSGTVFRFYVDDARDQDDIDSRHLEVIYDGKPSSPVFKVPPHWHTDHDEHWEMLEGRMIATIEGADIEMMVGGGKLVVPAGKVHCFRSIKGVPAVLKEQSAPPGPWKAL
jgi:mannose-6-phosphate isomerase-like protein (cupin superfamily)